MKYTYIFNDSHSVKINGTEIIGKAQLSQAIDFCNTALQSLEEQTKQFDIDHFSVLGMRNLSGLVGEYFVQSVQRFSGDKLRHNLHQDGYPDLLLTDTAEKKAHYDTLYILRDGKKIPIDKKSFVDYKYGGVEVKATCGSIPGNIIKPAIGEQRISLISSFDWKAHHRATNNLLAIFWDFINGVPTVAGCFYRNDLTEDDWGKVVKPTKEGSRSTSVSIMNSSCVRKMCEGWLAVIDMDEYIDTFAKPKWIGRKVK